MHFRFLSAGLLYFSLHAGAVTAQVTPPHVEFVREYIRELGEFERLRLNADSAMREPGANLMWEMTAYSTQLQLALRSDIAALQLIRLEPQHDGLLRSLISSHNTRLRVHGRIKEIAAAMLIGTQPGVDLGAMAAEMPALRSILDEIDAVFPDTSTLAFTTLVDPTPDSSGHSSRLRITAAERADLLQRLEAEFGDAMGKGGANTVTRAASVLRDYLGKGFTSADG